jgi:hypothetical protein
MEVHHDLIYFVDYDAGHITIQKRGQRLYAFFSKSPYKMNINRTSKIDLAHDLLQICLIHQCIFNKTCIEVLQLTIKIWKYMLILDSAENTQP